MTRTHAYVLQRLEALEAQRARAKSPKTAAILANTIQELRYVRDYLEAEPSKGKL